jgi:hypothetical protein
MSPSHMVHYAVACLEGLNIPLAPRDLSLSQRVPLEDCMYILRQFEVAGLVRENAQGVFERTCSIEQLTALDVLQALWRAPSGPSFRMLYGSSELISNHVIRQAVHANTRSNG